MFEVAPQPGSEIFVLTDVGAQDKCPYLLRHVEAIHAQTGDVRSSHHQPSTGDLQKTLTDCVDIQRALAESENQGMVRLNPAPQ